ncbi:beta-galactosidase [Fusarium mexicanum]|uniref:Beta-galactosidase n=1 Tax=Fusarium mexicanum TaxID=751941 RepID=A0A8H5J5Z6_9HYPO|nr:beta-galactosidase [Fusarium mexicanum]
MTLGSPKSSFLKPELNRDPCFTLGDVQPRRQCHGPILSSWYSGEVKSTSVSVETIRNNMLQENVTWNINGVNIFQRGPELSFYRALTQNDAASSGDGPIWEQEKIPMIYPQVRDVTWRVDDDGAVVHYKVWVDVKTGAWGVEADMIYKIPTRGPQFQLEARGEFVGKNESHVIPRIGLMAVLPESFDDVS